MSAVCGRRVLAPTGRRTGLGRARVLGARTQSARCAARATERIEGNIRRGRRQMGMAPELGGTQPRCDRRSRDASCARAEWDNSYRNVHESRGEAPLETTLPHASVKLTGGAANQRGATLAPNHSRRVLRGVELSGTPWMSSSWGLQPLQQSSRSCQAADALTERRPRAPSRRGARSCASGWALKPGMRTVARCRDQAPRCQTEARARGRRSER